jgi:hypothetical protein
MKEFPDILSVKNKSKLGKIKYNRVMCYLRKELYEHILLQPEDIYYEIDAFDKKYNKDMNVTKKMISSAIVELKRLGWKCIVSYGGTGMFIFSDKKPQNCYEDDLLS